MRSFFYLLLLNMVCISVSGQTESFGIAAAPSDSSSVASKQGFVRIRCGAFMTGKEKEPLVIIDGLPADGAGISGLDPEDILSVTVLKNAEAVALYGSRALAGVILVTTRSAGVRRFHAADLLSGDGLPGATLTFIREGDPKDTLYLIADGEGAVSTAELVLGEVYQVTVSSAGYHPLKTFYRSKGGGTVQPFQLERDVRENAPVTVEARTNIKLVNISCGLQTVIICSISKLADRDSSRVLPTSRAYPNPLPRGKNLRLELGLQEDRPLKIGLMNINGAVLWSMRYRSFKGLNNVDIPTSGQWAAGVYFLQVSGEDGKLLQQQKLIIQ